MANLEYTLTDFGSAIGDDGTKAIYFKYYIENTGGDEEYVGPVDFTIYVDDSAINKDYFLRMSGLESSESADIAVVRILKLNDLVDFSFHLFYILYRKGY